MDWLWTRMKMMMEVIYSRLDRNIFSPRDCGIAIRDSDEQFMKAPLPRLVNELGRMIINSLQRPNHRSLV